MMTRKYRAHLRAAITQPLTDFSDLTPAFLVMIVPPLMM
jgi:hypothetical protein